MKVILKEEILRLNCPGFGEQSFLTVGRAKPLDAYKVMIVNPVSILHLFDKAPEVLKTIDAAQTAGLTSVKVSSDDLPNALNDDISIRTEELVKFLENGGLLIYFLCRPFFLSGPTVSLDNYLWLLSLTPVKPGDKSLRQMSAAATGRNVEPTKEVEGSEFAGYFEQTGLEWNTVIRNESLNEGYTPLAIAGANKCIAAELYAGDNGGRIIFLPAPYSPDFDRKLVECTNYWYQKKIGEIPAHKQINPALTGNFSAPTREAAKPTLPVPSVKDTGTDIYAATDPDIDIRAAKNSAAPQAKLAETTIQGSSFTKPMTVSPPKMPNSAPGNGSSTSIPKLVNSTITNQPALRPPQANSANPPPKPPQSGSADLIKKMEAASATPVPQWCLDYSLSGIEELSKQRESLAEELKQLQARLMPIETSLNNLKLVKNSLLAGGNQLLKCCSDALAALGWVAKPAPSAEAEIWLSLNDKPEALARVILSSGQPKRSDLAQLAESTITFWGENEVEPKGILIACVWAQTPLAERKEAPFPDALIEFAQKQSICLLTTLQLLAAYRDIQLGKAEAEDIRKRILTTSGAISGLELEI